VSVKEILGHRVIQTTLRYSRLAPGHLREAVNRGSLSGIVTSKERERGEERCNLLILWCARRDLNPQPSDPKSDALSIELRAHAATSNTSNEALSRRSYGTTSS
jgi:hypothetical protein